MVQNSLSIKRYPTSLVSPPVTEPRSPSLLTRLFGCQHREMSRPFTSDGLSYRACLTCGARRSFDTETYEMKGKFYFENVRSQR